MKTLRSLFLRGRYLDLLIILAGIFLLQPFFENVFGKHILELLFIIALLSGFRAIGLERRFLRFELFLLALALILGILSPVFNNVALLISSVFAKALFLSLVVFVILRDIFRQREVSTDTLAGAVCAYLLIGVIWGLFFVLIEFMVPGSFSFTQGEARVDLWIKREFYPFYYFSLVTMTTVGYGDMAPLNTGARTLATSEALVGQLYLTILVARLVGMHLMGKKD